MTFTTLKTRIRAILLFVFLLLTMLALTPAATTQQGQSDKPIRLVSGDYYPEIVSPTSRSVQTTGFEGRYFKIIQFFDIPSEEQRQVWAKDGLHLVDYLHEDAYFAVIDQNFDLSSLADGVITIIDVPDLFKVEAELASQQLAGLTASRFIVSYYDLLDAQQIIADLESRGVIIEAHRDYSRQLDIVIEPWQFNTILNLPYLQFVGPEPAEGVLEPLDYRNSSGRSNYLNTGYNGLDYTGDGVTIAIGEGSTAGDHIDFQGRLVEFSSGSAGSHKVPVMQNAGGAGNLDPTNYNNATGATLISTGGAPDYAALHDSHGLRYSNHSLGYGISGGYDSSARNHDLRTAAYPYHVVIYSAGNSGGSTGFSPYDGFSGWANITGKRKQNKNHFAIGSLTASDAVAGFSSRGPMYDGRVYPQLIIEGGGGTSFAAPKIAGLMAILSEAYQDLNGGAEPPANLLRAIMMNTADEVDDPGPDYKSGYGRPNMRRAYDVIDSGQYLTATVSHAISNTHTITVPANTEQVRVMIVWPDTAAAVNASTALINNLDLLLTDPTATTSYQPWVLDHTANTTSLDAPATRQVDTLNTIEQVTVDNPAAGTWTIQVDGTDVPMGPQEYYLVYEFLMDELLVAYPLEDEGFVPGDTYRLKWDSYSVVSDTFTLDYQLDGGSWVNIATGYDADSRNYDWTAPSVGTGIHTIKFRVQRGVLTAESGVNYIGERPSNLAADWACADVAQLSWDGIDGATDYTVYRLGTKYMEPVVSGITFDGTSAQLTGLSTTEDEHFAIAAQTSGNEGLRTEAMTKTAGDLNCFNAKTTAASSIDKTDITLNGLVNPHGATLTNVRFEYGPTAAYGSMTPNISISATGHVEEAVSSVIASTLISRTDVLHYRLVVTKDGLEVYGDDQEIRLAPGYALSLDGSGDPLNLGQAQQITGDGARSIAGWAKAESFNGAAIMQAGNSGTTGADFSLRTNTTDDQWRGQFWGAGTFILSLPGSKDSWHHYALTYDGTTARFYYDGELVHSVSTTLDTEENDLLIGEWEGNEFDGQLDEISYWSKALSAAEIQDMMHQPLAGDEADLLHYMTFDSRSDQIIDYVSLQELASSGNTSKAAASTPFGIGDEFVATETAGLVDFTGTGVTADYASHNSATAIVAKIALSPNTTDGLTGATVFDEQYWVTHRQGSGSFSADLTFAVAEDLTAADEASLSQIQLFGRDKGSDGVWGFVALASAVDAAADEATFDGIAEFDQQFILVRNTNPFISATPTVLPFINMPADGAAQQQSYTLSGINLTDNLDIQAPGGFQISTDSASGFANSLSLPPASGTVLETIYVQYTAAQGVMVPSSTVINSSIGAVSVTVTADPFEAVPVADYATQAIVLDGSDQQLQVQNFDWNPNSIFTIEWWLKPDTYKSWNQQIGNGWGAFLFHTNSSGVVSAGITNNSGSRINSASGTIKTGVWQHFAFTLDGANAKLYIDGELIGEVTGSNGKNSNWGYFDIGKSDSSTIDGQIDEFRMWSVARTQQEIRDNMHNVLAGSESGLELYLQFNALTGDVIDLSNNHYEVAMFNDPVMTASAAPVGTVGEFVNTQTETAVGDVGKQLKTTIMSTPSSTDYLGIYRTGDESQVLFDETFPAGILWRSDLFWGVQEFGDVTADLVIDYSTLSGINQAAEVKLLKRADVTAVWTDVTADFVHDPANRTFTKAGESGFSEFAIAGTAVTAELSIVDGGGGQVNLSWSQSPVTDCQYDIYRSAVPYDSFTLIEDDWASMTLTDAGGAIGTAGTNYFYYVEIVKCSDIMTSLPPSTTIGEFDFELKPGE